MARKPPKSIEADDDSPKGKKRADDKALLEELRERNKKCDDADHKNREGYKANMRFVYVPGEQWTQADKNDRGKDRVMYQFNRMRARCKYVINGIRENRPSVKIRPFEEGDIQNSEIRKAVHDNIWNASDGDSVIDYCAEHQVAGGMGAARIVTRYCEDSADEQDIFLEAIQNPMCLKADYACQKQDKSDARFWIYAAKLSKEAYDAKYPGKDRSDFEFDDDLEPDTEDEDGVWVAEYWRKEPVKKTVHRLATGETVEDSKLPAGAQVVKSRTIDSHKIVQYICSGNAVLEGPNEWAGKDFPFIVVYGEYLVIEGKVIWCGLPEHGKDPARGFNWVVTSIIEALASQPLSTTWVSAVQAAGHVNEWAEAVRKNFPIKVFNPDPLHPGVPQREQTATISPALIQSAAMMSSEMDGALGLFPDNVGEQSNAQSGRAIRARQSQGAIATFNYPDNMAKFVRRIHEIFLDIVPKVIDTQRTIRILGRDGAEKYLTINQRDPVTGEVVNDLSAGKYDLVVTQGANYATQRQEAADFYTQAMQANPQLAMAAGDLIMKAQDLPYAQEIGDRLRALLPPPIQQLLNKDGPQDPQVIAAMQQVEQQAAMIQEQAAAVQQAAVEAQTEQASATKAKSDVQMASANLKVQEAELGRQVAEFQKLVAETQAKFAQQDAAKVTADTEQERGAEQEQTAQLVQGIAEELQRIQAQTADMLQQTAEQLAQITMAPKPATPKTAVSQRANGGYVTQVMGPDGRVVGTATTARNGPQMVTTFEPAMVQ